MLHVLYYSKCDQFYNTLPKLFISLKPYKWQGYQSVYKSDTCPHDIYSIYTLDSFWVKDNIQLLWFIQLLLIINYVWLLFYTYNASCSMYSGFKISLTTGLKKRNSNVLMNNIFLFLNYEQKATPKWVIHEIKYKYTRRASQIQHSLIMVQLYMYIP